MSTAIAHWSPANQERAKEILDRYPERRSALMPLMYLASLEHDHASDRAMVEVASLVGVTPAQVKSVVSFYTMFKAEEVGRYLVSVCTSISCHLLGGDEVLSAVEETSGVAHGETGTDGTFSVEHVECIGIEGRQTDEHRPAGSGRNGCGDQASGVFGFESHARADAKTAVGG